MLVLLKLVLTRLVILCVDSPSEGTIRHRLRKLNLNELQHALNRKLKDEFIKICAKEILSTLLIDFVNIPYYGDKKNTGNTIKTKTRYKHILLLRLNISNIRT